MPALIDLESDARAYRGRHRELVDEPARGEIGRDQIVSAVRDQEPRFGAAQQGFLQRRQGDAETALAAPRPIPIPLLGDFARQYPVGQLGAVAEPFRRVDVEGGGESRDGGVEHRIAGAVVPRVRHSRALDGRVVNAQQLLLRPAQLMREHFAGDAAAFAPHDLLGEANRPGYTGDEWVARDQDTFNRGQPDQVVRQGKALHRADIVPLPGSARQRRRRGGEGGQPEGRRQRVADVGVQDRNIERRGDQHQPADRHADISHQGAGQCGGAQPAIALADQIHRRVPAVVPRQPAPQHRPY